MKIDTDLTDLDLRRVAEEVLAMADDPLSPDFARLFKQYTENKIEIGLLRKMNPTAVERATQRKIDDWLREYGL